MLDSVPVIEIVVGLTGGGVFGFVRWLLNRRDRLTRERLARDEAWPRMLARTTETFGWLNWLLARTAAHRVVVAVAEDSGGRPRLGKPVYTHLEYQVYDSPLAKLEGWEERRKAGGEELELLARLASQGSCRVVAGDGGDPVRDQMVTEQVVASDWYLLNRNDVRMDFMILDRVDGSEPSAGEKAATRVAVSHLRRLWAEEWS